MVLQLCVVVMVVLASIAVVLGRVRPSDKWVLTIVLLGGRFAGFGSGGLVV
jgi:hypothetical protein